MDFSNVAPLTPRHHQSPIKQICERLLALALLVVSGPLLIVLMLAVRLTSRGPAVIRQERIGLFGKPFWMYKLRSMVADAEQASGAVWATENDPRVTRLGSILRKLHLDELPQLVNIFFGEMSFVGPRPERPVFVKQLAAEIPGYVHRLAVRPGVTGLAQINLAPDQTTDCVRRKLELDMQYLFLGGWGIDLRIALCTLLKMAGVPREAASRLMMLNCCPTVFVPSAPTATGPAPHEKRRTHSRPPTRDQRRPVGV